jgi:hypothetical protein
MLNNTQPDYSPLSFCSELKQDPAVGLLTPIVNECIDRFFIDIYPVQPVINCLLIENATNSVLHFEEYSMVTALCAYINIVREININLGIMLREESVQKLAFDACDQSPSVLGVFTLHLLHRCYRSLEENSRALKYLQRAASLVKYLRIDSRHT